MYLYLWCRLQLRQGNLSHRGAPIRRLLVRLLRTTDVGMPFDGAAADMAFGLAYGPDPAFVFQIADNFRNRLLGQARDLGNAGAGDRAVAGNRLDDGTQGHASGDVRGVCQGYAPLVRSVTELIRF